MNHFRRQLGPYWLEAHLATGGMGKVFLASQQADGEERLVVLKVLDERFRDDETTKAMFRDEARLLSLLHHPNIVTAYGSGLLDDMPFIALEYLAGDNLSLLARRAHKRERPLSLSLITRVAVQVANALEYIHTASDEQGRPLELVHRDVSPQNIFILYDGKVKLLDFGIAMARRREARTATGMLKGKLRYMSPEQVQMRPLDGRSDLFSLGVVLWELVAGAKLFDADSDYQIMKQICEAPRPSLRERRAGIPGSLEAVVMKLLQHRPEARFQSAAELRERLMNLLLGDLAGSPADEIESCVAELIGERRRAKEQLIAGIHRRGELQTYLFGDLEDSSENSATSDKRLLHRYQGADKHQDTIDAGLGTDDVQPAGENRARGKFGWRLPVAGLLASAILAWLVSPSGKHGDSPYIEPGTVPLDAGPSPSRDARDVGLSPGKVIVYRGVDGESAGSADLGLSPHTDVGLSPNNNKRSQDVTTDGGRAAQSGAGDAEAAASQPVTQAAKGSQPRRIGWLRLQATPRVEVFIDGKQIGTTPVTDLELAPGVYRVRLLNKEAGIDTFIKVRIRNQEVTSQQYFF